MESDWQSIVVISFVLLKEHPPKAVKLWQPLKVAWVLELCLAGRAHFIPHIGHLLVHPTAAISSLSNFSFYLLFKNAMVYLFLKWKSIHSSAERIFSFKISSIWFARYSADWLSIFWNLLYVLVILQSLRASLNLSASLIFLNTFIFERSRVF